MNIGVQVKDVATGAIGVIEKGTNPYFVNFGTKKGWKMNAELTLELKETSPKQSRPVKQTTATADDGSFQMPTRKYNAAASKYATVGAKTFANVNGGATGGAGINNIIQQFGNSNASNAPPSYRPAQAPKRLAMPDFGSPPSGSNNNAASSSSTTTTPPKTSPTPSPYQSESPRNPETASAAPSPARVAAPVKTLSQVVQPPQPAPITQATPPVRVPPPPVVTATPTPVATLAPPVAASPRDKDMWHINFSELVLGDVIGTGKYGEVSLGTYLGTPVAIKRILECNEETNLMIDRELQILKEVRHPNIVQFLGATKHKDEIYIITELMEKGDLFDSIIFGDSPLSWKKKVGIALDIAQACTYLQARGILHRDLKSQNVLLTTNYRAKLCDLGLARVFEDQMNKRLTFVGSDRWMAPEIFMSESYDYKVDVFSYGIVLVELITNGVPDERLPHKMFAFETQSFLNKVPADCPPAFSKLTVQCTLTNPKERPSFVKILEIVKGIYDGLEDEDDQ
eukprot:gene217-265_t